MTSVELIIDRQIRRWELQKKLEEGHRGVSRSIYLPKPLITISSQHGSGGSAIANQVAYRFNYTLFLKNVLELLRDNPEFQKRMRESVDNDPARELNHQADSICGDRAEYRPLVETVLNISWLGGIVIVGSAANFIVGPNRGLHVRVVGSVDSRIKKLSNDGRLDIEQAKADIARSDSEQEDFVHKLLNRSIDDPQAYDLVINTDWIAADQAVMVIANASMEKFEKLASLVK